jgi:hypothetical protein
MSNIKLIPIRCYHLLVNEQRVSSCYARNTVAAIRRFIDAGFGDVPQKDCKVTASEIVYAIPETEL